MMYFNNENKNIVKITIYTEYKRYGNNNYSSEDVIVIFTLKIYTLSHFFKV